MANIWMVFWMVFGVLVTSISVWEGEPIILPCGLMGKDADVEWCKETNSVCQLILAKMGDDVTVPKWPWGGDDVTLLNTSSLKITSTSYSRDNGRFRCEKMSSSISLYLDVFQPVSGMTVTGPSSPASSGTPVRFTCQVEGGHPAPNITWYLGDSTTPVKREMGKSDGVSEYNDSETRVSEYTMTVTREMDGQRVVCEASIFNKSSSDETTLDVRYKPGVRIKTIPVQYSLGDDVILECSADGNPRPEVSWMFAGKVITSLGTENITFGDQRPRLRRSRVIRNRNSPSGVQPIKAEKTVVNKSSDKHPVKFTKGDPNSDTNVDNLDGMVLVHQNKSNKNNSSAKTCVTTRRQRIAGLVESDLGIYTCTARNTEGLTTGILSVSIGASVAEPAKQWDLTTILPTAGFGVAVVILVIVVAVHKCPCHRTGPLQQSEHDMGSPETRVEIAPMEASEENSETNTYLDPDIYMSDDSYLHPVSPPTERGPYESLGRSVTDDNPYRKLDDVDEIRGMPLLRRYFISNIELIDRSAEDYPQPDGQSYDRIADGDSDQYQMPFPLTPKRHTY